MPALDIRELLRLLDMREQSANRFRHNTIDHAELQALIQNVEWRVDESGAWGRRLYLHADPKGLLLEVHDHAILGEDEYDYSYFVLFPRAPGARPLISTSNDFPLVDQIGAIES